MIMADTSVWVDHLRKLDTSLVNLLRANRICIHPFIIGELALGHLKNRNKVLQALHGLPHLSVANDNDVMGFIETHDLFGKGIGLVDVHLLAAAHLKGNCAIWARDKRLFTVADSLKLTVKNLKWQCAEALPD